MSYLNEGPCRIKCNSNYKYNCNLNSTDVNHTEEEVDIAVTTDSKRTFKLHMALKVKKANSLAGIIQRTFKCLDYPSTAKLFKTMVKPHLEYTNSVWKPHEKYV